MRLTKDMGTVMIDNGKLSDEEYKCLREELLNHISCIQNYNIALYSTSALILSFTVSREEFYYSLLPLVVIIPLYILREKHLIGNVDTIFWTSNQQIKKALNQSSHLLD